MNSRLLPGLAANLLASLLFTVGAMAQAPTASSGTHVLKWKDGKQAVFLLAFDDAAPSQLKNAIPELQKRKLVGTFYLIGGSPLFEKFKAQWVEAAKSPSVVVANHTFTHKGVKSLEELEPELTKCTEVLRVLQPAAPNALFAFGRPGGVPWEVTEEQQNAALAQHQLINRPAFFGPPINLKSVDDVLAVVTKALERGEMGHLDFHGVGGDWLTTPMEWFLPLLSKLAENSETIWSTDTLTWHKYVKERESAAIKEVESTSERVRLELTSKMDPAQYDEPLTLSTTVPAAWKRCQIAQGERKAEAEVRHGTVEYSALPGGGEIVLTPL